MLIATDGSCSKNGCSTAKAGFGIIFENGTKISGPVKPYLVKNINYPEIEYYPTRQAPTNNRGELLGILFALCHTKTLPPGEYTIVTDSTYSMNIYTEWYKKWLDEGTFMSKKNPDIITLTDKILTELKNTGYTIEFIWQKAHVPNRDISTACARLNKIADDLADQGRLSESINIH